MSSSLASLRMVTRSTPSPRISDSAVPTIPARVSAGFAGRSLRLAGLTVLSTG